MTIEDLKSIVNHVEGKHSRPVQIKITANNKVFTVAEVETFGIFCDAFVLNINIDCDLKVK